MPVEDRVLEIFQDGNGNRCKLKSNLECIEPFGAIIWGGYTCYTTPSLLKKRFYSVPRYYLFTDNYKTEFKDRAEDRNLCLAEFISLMSEEEQAKAKENIVEIMEALEI